MINVYRLYYKAVVHCLPLAFGTLSIDKQQSKYVVLFESGTAA